MKKKITLSDIILKYRKNREGVPSYERTEEYHLDLFEKCHGRIHLAQVTPQVVKLLAEHSCYR
ncbi:MAG TPA: hypothetical protein VMV04_02040 [Thermodesulfobacteriota bacterium]|nr:hypothetical protein [Thermodesulfobacteriota bacterium]